MSLQRLLQDVSVRDFFKDYWGQKPLLIKRGQPNFYQQLFTLADIDALLFSARLRPGEYRISESSAGIDLQYRDNEEMQKSPPVTDFYREFNSGKSLVLHGLNNRWPQMAAVTRLLERAFACAVTTNVYLTPPNAKAYPLHYDSHDFLIFQLHGAKNWRIYELDNRRAPVRELLSLTETLDGAQEAWRHGALRQELELEAGDLLYIPRGYGHEATSHDHTSLHLTVGVHGMTWHGLLTNALARLAIDDETLRASIPIIPMSDNSGVHDLSREPEIRRLLDENLNLSNGLEVWHKLYLNNLEPIPDGHWLALERAATLNAETLVCRRFGLAAAVAARGSETIEFRFLKETITRPIAERKTLEFLAATVGPFSVSAIPGLAAAGQVALVRELVQKGFLTIVEAGVEQGGYEAIHRNSTSEPVAAQPLYAAEGGKPLQHSNEVAETKVAPMNDQQAEASPESQHGCSCNCGSCAQSSIQQPSYVYAIGRISARFPSIDIEKEVAQVVRASETVNLTDREVLHQVLSQSDNAYLAREMCWVFTVSGVETFTVIPRSGIELVELVNSLGLGAQPGATSIIIGQRSLLPLPASACGGLSLPTVVASKIYSYNIDDFVKELPLEEGQKKAGRELLERIMHLIDNVGDIDEHRAVNYLAVRYLAMYSLVVENFNRDFSLQGVGVSPVSTRSNRRLVDVTLRFVSRKTDVRELYAIRVDVTGMFPFLVSPLHPVFERD